MNCHYSLGCLACQVCNNAGVRARRTPQRDAKQRLIAVYNTFHWLIPCITQVLADTSQI